MEDLPCPIVLWKRRHIGTFGRLIINNVCRLTAELKKTSRSLPSSYLFTNEAAALHVRVVAEKPGASWAVSDWPETAGSYYVPVTLSLR